jgi:multicomponent Na+:H+ antiporter subunit E
MTARRWATALTVTRRVAAGAIVWVVLTGADLRSPLLAAALIAAAAATSLWLVPPGAVRVRWGGLASFLPFFVGASALGGIDVARRALDPRQAVAPELVEHRLRLPAGAPRTVFTATVSLLPGTLSAELRGDRLTIHVLDKRLPVRRTLSRLERRVGDLFGLEIEDATPSEPATGRAPGGLPY